MSKKNFLLILVLYTITPTYENANAQANLFVTTERSKKSCKTCVPFADSIYLADSTLYVASDTKLRSFPYKEILNISVSLNDSIGDSIIPKSLSMCRIEKIPYLQDLSAVETTAEEVVTDSSKVGFADFVENAKFDNTVNISYSSDSVIVTGLTDSISAKIDKNYVTITSKEKNVKYVLSGETTDGGFKLYGDNRFCITLNGANITSRRGSAINIQNKKRGYIVLTDNTVNRLNDAEKYNTPNGEDEKAAFFSEGQLCFSGKGQLHINAHKKSALASDEYIHICDGVINLYTSKNTCKTLNVKENLIIGGGFIQVRADGDAGKAISSDSLFNMTGGELVAIATGDAIFDADEADYSSAACIKTNISANFLGGKVNLMATGTGGKGINVGKVLEKDNNITIEGATINVLTLGRRIPTFKDLSEDKGLPSSSPKGIKAGYNLIIKSGFVKVNTLGGDGAEAIEAKNNFIMQDGTIMSYGVDDGINAVNAEISGGKIFVASSSNDGIDINGGMFINGGELYCVASNYMQGGIENDGKTFGYNNGTLVAIGDNNSSPWSSKGKGCSVMAYLKHPAKYVAIKDSEGNDVIIVNSTEIMQRQCLLIASQLLKEGETYSIYSSMEAEGGTENWGIITNASLVDPTKDYEFQFNERAITLGSIK